MFFVSCDSIINSGKETFIRRTGPVLHFIRVRRNGVTMKKKHLSILSVLCVSLLCACGTPSKAGGTLTICADGNGLTEAHLGPILAEFEDKYPDVELEVVYLPPVNNQDNAMTEARTAALTRTRTELMGGEGADIYLFFNRVSENSDQYMLFPSLERHIMGGIFHDLDFLFEDSGFDGGAYIPALKEAGMYEGKSYLLPLSYTCPALIATGEGLAAGSFDEDAAAADTTAYVDQLLSLPPEQRPYLNVTVPSLLLNAPSVSPVSVENAGICLETPVWQETLKQTKRIMEESGGSEDDFPAAMDFESCIRGGASILAGAPVNPAHSLRLLEDGGHTARLLPVPNENGSLTVMPCITAAVSAGCENTGAAARLLLFLLSDTIQGCGTLEHSGNNASLIVGGTSWPVRRGCAAKMTEKLSLQPVQPGEISETLRADLTDMENRADTCRLATVYDGALYSLIQPYLEGTADWEECYAAIEKEWSYLDE